MVIKEIQRFSEIRYKARAYLSYIFNRNIPNHLPGVSLDAILIGFDKIGHEIENFDAFYVLDANGVQLKDTISLNPDYITGMGENRSNKAYYYRAVRERRCVLTDPYPSSLNGELCVTASMPIYDDKNELKFIVCIDVSLSNILNIVNPGRIENYFGKFLRTVYSLFCMALFMICIFLFYHATQSFLSKNIEHINIEEIFESTIILTLALAIFDLVKMIFEAEVLGKNHDDNVMIYKTMVRFIGSIIIALAIEALMLVFKFAITAPENIINAIYLICGVALLMISLSVYLFSVKKQDSR
ncbi:PDC sensor domain-containing protein [Campylobacter sp. faydin G-24]|uniref:PDC sensor domain-containing protein n=1 Tax=Campylobacter anatolicus TaxID=2829105 RepID=A0ABS5HIU5_9BACT|nr:PDC sensor domain-containing protein [Campylobacter anatolicus]MBR8461712.1 PDC sensor domain-containing protein [Campylobacter anatolicus]MBR8463447.1 PDC sensor domain-containing protein [Campylobacter anatolicus]MBR8465201.1 PDC sensor domain-containing protein [Campylobacter anatolicus]